MGQPGAFSSTVATPSHSFSHYASTLLRTYGHDFRISGNHTRSTGAQMRPQMPQLL